MLMVTSVLNHAAPYFWERGLDYSNRRFFLFELNIGDTEYEDEINAFINGSPRIEVKLLRRVQNPFQLGSFILRKQQKEFRNDSVEVVKFYHPIHRNDLDIALEFNMDVRRYSNKYSGLQDMNGKNPKFYKTPGEAYNAFPDPDKIVLVCNVLCGSADQHSVITKDNSAEYMPLYVADM